MKTILIINIVGSTVAAIFCTVCLVGWFRSEKKLAKYGESILYKKDKENGQVR